jgi:hypothetical protein
MFRSMFEIADLDHNLRRACGFIGVHEVNVEQKVKHEQGKTEKRADVPEVAGVAELADALDSKSSTRKSVWVRTPPPVSPLEQSSTRED